MGTELWPPPWLLVPFPIPLCTWSDRKRESKQSVWSSFKKKGIRSQAASEHEIGSDDPIYPSQIRSRVDHVLCQHNKIVATYQSNVKFL
jgi:hypothetical protein